jgi:hypothetical protein
MLSVSHDQRRWLGLFGLTLGLLVGAALASSARLPSYRDPPFDFSTMSSQQLFVVTQLTRRQEGSVKVGFAEAYDPPEIGLYANHIFQYFGSEAFGRSDDSGYFFNYWYANLALPEIYRYLRHIEQLGRLPRKLIIVAITSPNIDNGQFIINFGNELPPDLILLGNEGDGILGKTRRFGEIAWNVVENWMHQTLNYNTFILGLLQSRYGERVVDSESCRIRDLNVSLPALVGRLPLSIQPIVGAYGEHYFCQRRLLLGAFRRDGSTDPAYVDAQLIQNEDLLKDTDRGLSAGDEREIARQMRAIDAIGRRHDIRVVFVVPPAYESDRDDSVVNQVFNRGLALVPELTIIDDREKRSDASLFVDYRHPSPKYFRILVDEMRRRGVVE